MKIYTNIGVFFKLYKFSAKKNKKKVPLKTAPFLITSKPI